MSTKFSVADVYWQECKDSGSSARRRAVLRTGRAVRGEHLPLRPKGWLWLPNHLCGAGAHMDWRQHMGAWRREWDEAMASAAGITMGASARASARLPVRAIPTPWSPLHCWRPSTSAPLHVPCRRVGDAPAEQQWHRLPMSRRGVAAGASCEGLELRGRAARSAARALALVAKSSVHTESYATREEQPLGRGGVLGLSELQTLQTLQTTRTVDVSKVGLGE